MCSDKVGVDVDSPPGLWARVEDLTKIAMTLTTRQ